MKKIMKILIVGVMCVSLAGCGNMTNTSTGSNAENSVVTPSPEPTKKETQKYKVGDVMYFAGDGIKYSVTIKKWGTSMDGSLMDLYSWKVYTYFNYEIENIGDNEAIINDDSIFSVYADDYAVETKWNEDTKIAEKLAPGRKITGKIYANFNADNAKNVELQVHDSIVLIKDENTEGQQEDSEDNEVDSTSTPDTTTDYEESFSDVDSYEESSSDDDDEYILSYSSDRLLTVSDVELLSKEQCRYARNEIYARHGRKFSDKKLQAYFDSKSWYVGTIEPNDFDESELSKIEKKNIKYLKQFENN